MFDCQDVTQRPVPCSSVSLFDWCERFNWLDCTAVNDKQRNVFFDQLQKEV